LKLLEPTIIYVKPILNAIEKGLNIKGLANITGGGFYENIPRMFKDDFTAIINRDSIKFPKIMTWLKSFGINDKDMFSTFNCGIGMVLATSKKEEDNIIKHFEGFNFRSI